MTWSVLQSCIGFTGSGTTTPATFTTNLTAGSKLICFVATGSSSGDDCSSVKDTAGNSFTELTFKEAGFGHNSIWVLDTPSGDVGTKPTITATHPNSGDWSILVQEVSGLATGTTLAAIVDGTLGSNANTVTSGALATPAYSSSVSGEYLVGFFADAGFNATVSNPPSGYTADPNNINNSGINDLLVWHKNSTGGSETLGASITSGSSSGWSQIFLAFKLAGGGTGGNVNLTTPNLALAAPAVTPAGGANVALNTPNLALAAPAVTPSGAGSPANVNLTTPNLALAAPVITPSGGSVSANVNLTTPNLALAAPLVSPAGAGVGALSVANQWTVSDTTGYGPADVAVSNTAGNALVAYLSVGSDNISGYCPRISIADDAHNWWIFAGSKIDATAGATRRLDIWICPDAQAASVISVTAGQVYAGLTGRIVEFKNFPSFAQIDFVNISSGVGTTVTSGSLAVTGQDYLFTSIVTAGATPGSVTYPSWNGTGANVLTNATTGSALTDMSNLTVVPNYWAAPVSGTHTVSYSWTNSASYNFIAIGFSVTPATPAQSNPNWPGIKVEAAFGFQPGNLTGAMPTWTDITSRMLDDSGAVTLSATRGRDYELTQPAAGKVTMPLNNQDGAFNPANTGSPFYPNVLPEVPVRVSAVWQGKTYGLAYCYAQKWPQTFPYPQWGWIAFEGGDAVGIASQGSMPSAYQGEVLADYPQGAWALGEFYSVPNGASFANYSRTSTRPMTGYSPSNLKSLLNHNTPASLQLQTGQVMGLAGDQSSGIGITSLSAYDTTGAGGAFVRDANLPALTAATYDFWCIPTYVGSTPASTFVGSVDLVSLLGTPANYLPVTVGGGFPSNNGARLDVAADFETDASSKLTKCFFSATLYNPAGAVICVAQSAAGTLTSGNLYHIAVKTSYNGSGTWTVSIYVNGVLANTATGSYTGTLANKLPVLAAGPVIVSGGTANVEEYSIGQVATYPWLVPDARIARHYAVGATADAGDPVTTRMAKLMAWSGLQLPFGSTGSSAAPLMGNADQTQGSALTDQLGTLSQTEGGMFYAPATAQGEIWYQSRQSTYNKPSTLTFGDEATVYLNQSWNFSGTNTLLWTPTGCTRSQSLNFPYAGPFSMQVIGNAGTSTPSVVSERFPVQALQNYAVNPIVMTPQGWATGVQVGFNWFQANGTFISSTSGAVTPLVANLPTVAPSGTHTAPANAAFGQIYFLADGTPGTGIQFYVAGAGAALAGEIAYLPSSGFDFSDTFLYNIVSSQRTISETSGYITDSAGATLQTFNNYGVTADVADTASETQYMPRGPLQLDIETTSDQDAYDRANWALVKYKQPQLRANQIQLDPASNPAIFGAVLSVEQGDIVTVNRRPTGAPAISVLCIVQQVKHEIGPDNWLTTLTLAPYYPENAVVQLDNPSFNELQDGVLAW